MAYATNQRAAKTADEEIRRITFEGRDFDLCWKDDHVLVHGDTGLADRMAKSFGTVAEHCSVKNADTTFSIVPLK